MTGNRYFFQQTIARCTISIAILLFMAGAVLANEPVRVGVFQNKPVVYIENGPQGLFVDLLDAVAKEEDWELEYVPCELKSCLQMLASNELDLMTSLGINKKRLDRLVFSKEPIWTFWGIIYSHDNRITGVFDLEGLTIGVRRENKITAALKKMLGEFKITVTFREFDNYEAAYLAFKANQLDAVAVNNTYGFDKQKEIRSFATPIVFNPFSAYFAAPKNSQHVAKLAIIDRYVRRYKQQDDSVFTQFKTKWFNVPDSRYSTQQIIIFAGFIVIVILAVTVTWRYRFLVTINRKLQESIADRELAEKKLTESNLRLMNILDSVPADIHISDLESFEILYMNRQMIESFGRDMTGEKCWKALRSSDGPCDFCTNSRLVDANGRPKGIQTWEDFNIVNKKHYLNHDRAIFWTDGNIVRIQFAIDITLRKRIEQDLRENEARFRNVVQKAAAGYFLIDVDGHFRDVNDAWLKMHGFDSADQVTGKHFSLTQIEEDLEKATDILDYILSGESIVAADSSRRNNDGSIGYNIFTAVPVITKGVVTGLEGFLIDTTDKQDTEQKLKTSLQEKETLLQEIHHRVKNNMQVISSLLQLQSHGLKNERAKDALKESRNRVYAMSIIHEMLYQSKSLSRINLKEYLAKISASMLQTYSTHPVNISFEFITDEIRVSINQASALGIIITELMSNSIKYAFPDDATGHVSVTIKEEGKDVRLEIADTGVGLPEGFDWHSTDTLGLKLVRTLVENQLNGSVEIESNSGLKATIQFEKEQI